MKPLLSCTIAKEPLNGLQLAVTSAKAQPHHLRQGGASESSGGTFLYLCTVWDTRPCACMCDTRKGFMCALVALVCTHRNFGIASCACTPTSVSSCIVFVTFSPIAHYVVMFITRMFAHGGWEDFCPGGPEFFQGALCNARWAGIRQTG